MTYKADDKRFAAWLRKPPTPEEVRLAAQLTPEKRQQVEQWLIPTLVELTDKSKIYPVS